jgi:hypothetical protein
MGPQPLNTVKRGLDGTIVPTEAEPLHPKPHEHDDKPKADEQQHEKPKPGELEPHDEPKPHEHWPEEKPAEKPEKPCREKPIPEKAREKPVLEPHEKPDEAQEHKHNEEAETLASEEKETPEPSVESEPRPEKKSAPIEDEGKEEPTPKPEDEAEEKPENAENKDDVASHVVEEVVKEEAEEKPCNEEKPSNVEKKVDDTAPPVVEEVAKEKESAEENDASETEKEIESKADDDKSEDEEVEKVMLNLHESVECHSGIWLFTDRENISHFFEPNFLPPYDTPEKRKIILDVLKEEWDEKTLSWKPCGEGSMTKHAQQEKVEKSIPIEKSSLTLEEKSSATPLIEKFDDLVGEMLSHARVCCSPFPKEAEIAA